LFTIEYFNSALGTELKLFNGSALFYNFSKYAIFLPIELLAKVRNLPFDRLRVNGLRLKLFSFSVRGEPFDSPFALRFSKGERFAQDKLVEPQKNTFARGSIFKKFKIISVLKGVINWPN